MVQYFRNPKTFREISLTNLMIPWSQSDHFVTTVPLTRTGVLYPRMRDFFILSLIGVCIVQSKAQIDCMFALRNQLY